MTVLSDHYGQYKCGIICRFIGVSKCCRERPKRDMEFWICLGICSTKKNPLFVWIS
ncbi:unnamed protein product [Brugia timori]|uniref:Uncharacterized protein n=1 Tax=Brugia timori TaxID=42155 RepID=A0A0R3Q894_9BILA|nr:unnamed protein product [Brugia timori]